MNTVALYVLAASAGPNYTLGIGSLVLLVVGAASILARPETRLGVVPAPWGRVLGVGGGALLVVWGAVNLVRALGG